MKKLIVLMAVVAVAITGFASLASATLVLSLGIGNAGISGFAGPYGTVSVTRLNATTANIEFTSNTVAGNIYLFGDGGSVALNVNGTVNQTFILPPGKPTNAGTGFLNSGANIDIGGAGNQDGFGSFNYSLNTFDGFTHSWDHMGIQIVALGTGWASDADVLTANANGFLVSAHIYVTPSPANASNGALATGFATNGGTPTVPEPTSMLLLGLGLAGVGAARRRRKH